MVKNQVYDAIIVGGGPSGLTAGIYLSRAKLKTLILEKYVVGGTVNLTYEIKNYPGFKKINGADLVVNMYEQALDCGVEIKYEDVTNYVLDKKIKEIITRNGTFFAKTVILCNGASAKKLGLEKEDVFTGKGVSYCATCDGAFFKDQIVAVVGGGNTACEDAIYLSNLAKQVYIFVRKSNMIADKVLIDNVESKKNIKILYNTQVSALLGNDRLEGVNIFNDLDNSEKTIKLSGLFVAIGRVPLLQSLPKEINLSKGGFVITNENMETNIKGVYACGDIREKSVKQIVTACSDGAIAGSLAGKYVNGLKEDE